MAVVKSRARGRTTRWVEPWSTRRSIPGRRGSGATLPLMAFHWRFTPADAAPADPPAPSSFTSQSDAESWVGESWRSLAAAGVLSVTLLDGQSTVYEMPLSAE